MVAVTQPHAIPKSASVGGFGHNLTSIATLAALAAALLAANWFGQPRGLVAEQWYGMSNFEGVSSYTPYSSEQDCRASSGGDLAICGQGADFQH